jgi:motility quorum-sensing regulator/GCU-specific mRNA interferase toxin
MEKRTPHCPLVEVKRLAGEGKIYPTTSASEGAALLGLEIDGIIEVVLALTMGDFYKSMTTHFDHKVWQDVYRPSTAVGDVYLKLTVSENVLIVSFKKL